MVLVARAAQFVEAFLPLLLLQSIGAGAGSTAVVLVIQQVASTLTYWGEGRLVRAFGLTGVIRWGLLGSAVAVGGLAAAESITVAAVFAAMFGAASGAWRAAVQAAVPSTLATVEDVPGTDEADDDDVRSRAFGAIFWAANLGAIASAAAGALGLPLRWLLAAQAVTTGVAFLLSWLLPDSVGRADSLPVVPATQAPTAADTRRARRDTRVLMLAFVPATMLMFQAFGGLAVAMPADAYRQMVLVNAIVLVLAQPLTVPLLRRAGATAAILGGIVAMATGIAAQAFWPAALGWTVLWTLGELVIVIVPGALVTAAAPMADAAEYVGRFQVAQGLAAAVALYIGPVLAGAGSTPFAWGCGVAGAAGVAAVLAARQPVRAAWTQPITCPCGALFCVCDRTYAACASPSPVLTHQAMPDQTENPTA